MKAFLLALWASAALAAPAWARDYAAVVAFDDSVEYLDPSTVKTDGEIKTFWTNTVYIRTNNLGIDWTSEHVSVDCNNDRTITLGIIGYRMNGDVVASTENNPNVQRRWIDIPPETGAAAVEDAVCHGHVLGTDSGASFSEVVPVARRRLIQIAAKKTEATRPAYSGVRAVAKALGRAMIEHSSGPASEGESGRPGYSASGTEEGQPVYSASECVGPIVAGVCHGAILPNQATHPVCHGEMLNGTCTGPLF
jgi:hypothetical protein